MVTNEQKRTLVTAACEVRQHAYAPYSRYAVGAAILTEQGEIVTGVNVENASYGLTICAERSAIATAAGQGVRRLQAIAICTENGGSPCGACRQVISEFAGDIPVLLSDSQGNVRETTLHALLPELFGPTHLV